MHRKLMSKKALTKLHVVIVAVIIVVAALSGIGYYLMTLPSEKKTISVLNGWSYPNWVAGLNRIIDGYEKLHPEIGIELHSMEWGELIKTFAALKAVGEHPDMMFGYSTLAINLWESGDLLPVNDVIEELGGLDHFVPEQVKLGEYDPGKYYCIPAGYTQTCIYREDLFEEKGLSVDMLATWDGLLHCAEVLTEDFDDDGVIDRYGIGYLMGSSYFCGEMALGLVWQNGGHLLSKEGNVVFDSPESREALEFLKKLHKYMPPDVGEWQYSELRAAYLGDRVAMTFDTSSIPLGLFYNTDPDLLNRTGIFRLPVGPSAPAGMVPILRGGQDTWNILSTTDNYDEVVDFAVYSWTTDNFWELAKEDPGGKGPNTIPSIAEKEEFWEIPLMKALGEKFDYYMEELMPYAYILQFEYPGVYTPNTAAISNAGILNDLVQDLCLRDQTVEEVMAKYVPQMREITGEA